MNERAMKYWSEFWGEKEQPQSVDAWKFGDEPDRLAQMVIQGIKKTTTSTLVYYQEDNPPLPVAGAYRVILNSQDDPVAIIKLTEIQVMPMNRVPVEHTADEGDCGLNGEFWWEIHERYFRDILKKKGRTFSEDMLVVCKRFELVDIKD